MGVLVVISVPHENSGVVTCVDALDTPAIKKFVKLIISLSILVPQEFCSTNEFRQIINV